MARWIIPSLLLALGSAVTCVLAEEVEPQPWPLCPVEPTLGLAPTPSRPDFAPGTTEVFADTLEHPHGGEVSTLLGNVELTRDDQALRADRLRYSETGQWIEADGRVQVWSPELLWAGSQARWQLDSDVGELSNGEFQLPQSHARGRAKELVTDRAAETTALRGLRYTTCPTAEEFWRLDASRMTLDHAAERGSARDVVLRISDLPVLYLPYISFPTSDKRKSGLLWPVFGTTQRSGTELAVPFYWNIAPERDATLTPRVMSERGLMLGGEYRYLMARGAGELAFEYLPDDDARRGTSRSLLAFNHHQRFMDDRLTTALLFNGVSDKEYFEDFGSQISVSSQRFLERRADALYAGEGWGARAVFQGFQVVDRSLTAQGPYQRLPQLQWWGVLPGGGNKRLNYTMNAEAVYFDRNESVTGGRVDLWPAVSLPWRTPSGFVVPKVSLRYTGYWLHDPVAGGYNPDRLLPYASLDTGLYFDRPASLAGRDMTQTLEPRAYYLYVPFRNQADLPVFDTGQYDFTFDQLFREDRFSGPDRAGDTNQITLGLTSRLLDSRGGLERLRASLGQIWYFEDRDVTLPGRVSEADQWSEFIAEVAARPTRSVRARAGLTWNPELDETGRATLGLRYQPDLSRVVNLDYRLRKDIRGLGNTEVEQTDASFRWPLNPNWGAVGRWTYSLRTGESVDTFGGLEYNSCCWAARVVARRFLRTSGGEFDNGIFFQIELKGLAGIGSDARRVLEQNIPGYTSEF